MADWRHEFLQFCVDCDAALRRVHPERPRYPTFRACRSQVGSLTHTSCAAAPALFFQFSPELDALLAPAEHRPLQPGASSSSTEFYARASTSPKFRTTCSSVRRTRAFRHRLHPSSSQKPRARRAVLLQPQEAKIASEGGTGSPSRAAALRRRRHHRRHRRARAALVTENGATLAVVVALDREERGADTELTAIGPPGSRRACYPFAPSSSSSDSSRPVARP